MKNYAVACPTRKDRDVTPDDIKNKHLILIGNAETNSVLRELLPKVPLRIERDYISLGDKRYDGNGLGVAAIYPNPLNLEKYIVIAGANGHDGYRLIESNLSLKGWYDFAIWNSGNVLATGHWDHTWRNPIVTR